MSPLRRVIALGAALTMSASAFAQCGSPNSCLEPHGGLGCVVPECCALVCEANPLCCKIAWDAACVTLAEDLCDGLTCPSPGSCTTPHFTPGCDDSTCCHETCRLDPYCCFTAWDALCVEVTDLLCGVAECDITIPANAIDEAEPCYERLNDGCSFVEDATIPIACGEVHRGTFSTGSPRDTDWRRFTVSQPGRYRLELTAEFPSQLLLVRGSCQGPLETLSETHGLPCVTQVVEWCLEPGIYSCIVSGGVPSRAFRGAFPCDEIDPKNPPDPNDPPPEPSPYGRRYVLAMSCSSCLVGDLDGDGVVGPADLALLLGAWNAAGGAADLNGDGMVGAADLALLLGGWST